MGRELGGEHGGHVLCTCSSTPRAAAALASLCRRRRRPSLRSEIAAHSARPPVPRCAVGCLCLQSAHRWMGRELGDEHGFHVLCTCSSSPRVAALASLCRRRRRPSLRSEIAAHFARPPVPRCAVGCRSLQSAHRWMGRELGDEHGFHVLCTCSSISRVAALASLRRRPFPIPSPRDRYSIHTNARPSLRCRVPMPSISPSVTGT
jgi:hypothetical protein